MESSVQLVSMEIGSATQALSPISLSLAGEALSWLTDQELGCDDSLAVCGHLCRTEPANWKADSRASLQKASDAKEIHPC